MRSCAAIRGIEYHLPVATLTTADLSERFPDWGVERIESRTGIHTRHIAAADECASDLAYEAALKLFASGVAGPSDIDFLILCTQYPDYFVPTTACTLQSRLGLRTDAGAMDMNLGTSGFVYALGLAKGLIETGQARNVLVLTADTYSKFIHPLDRSVRTIFGDGAAATLVSGIDSDQPRIGPFVYGTDGSGAQNIIVKGGAARLPRFPVADQSVAPEDMPERPAGHLFMDGAEVFAFTLSAVPALFDALLRKSALSRDDIDLFVFHQANRHILETLRKKLAIPADRFVIAIGESGNTVSSTIPIAMKHALGDGRIEPGKTVALLGYGMGLSWGGTIVRW